MSVLTSTLDHLELESLFDSNLLSYDPREGVLFNPAKTRLCLLSSDLLLGVYKAVLDEAGPAWRQIFKHCGKIWGQRLVRRLERECVLLAGVGLADLPLERFLSFVKGYFVFHGWGTLELDVTHSMESGVVEATLSNSIFCSIIDDPDGMVDPLIAGILCSMLGHLSQRELDCIQTACGRTDSHSRFVITAPERLEALEKATKTGSSHTAILESLRKPLEKA
jgi:uncharacterized protein